MNHFNLSLEEEKAHKMHTHVFAGIDGPPLGALGPYAIETLNNYENRQLFDDGDARLLVTPNDPHINEGGQESVLRFDDDPLKSSASHALSLVKHQVYGTRNLWNIRGFLTGYHDHMMDIDTLKQQKPSRIAPELEYKAMEKTLSEKKSKTVDTFDPPNDAILANQYDTEASSHRRFVTDLLPLKKSIPNAPSNWYNSLGNMSYVAEEADLQFLRRFNNLQPIGSAFTR